MPLKRSTILAVVFAVATLIGVFVWASPTSTIIGGSPEDEDGEDAVQTDGSDAANGDDTSTLTLPGVSGDQPDQQPATSVDGEGVSTETTVPQLDAAEWARAYEENLAFVRSASTRNVNHDDSPYRNIRSADLVLSDHFGPRSEYLGNPGGNPEQSFPIAPGGQFRAGCEFSHFAYDDPLVAPFQPGASHLHMFFGNTDVNAFSTYDTLINSGSSTCNGQELNRTGYWVPAMFDGEGFVRIPERVVVYYKGEGASLGGSVPYPPGAALIATEHVNALPDANGGSEAKFSFVCSDQFSGPVDDASNTIPVCDGNTVSQSQEQGETPRVVLEMNVKFPQCWNGQDPSDWRSNFSIPTSGSWYQSNCPSDFATNLPNLEYFVNYVVEPGETTADWYLSSDVDPVDFTRSGPGGASVHGDWWGGWNAEVNQLWIDDCVNFSAASPSGCGFGYLTDGGTNGAAPLDGPALKYRPQYEGPNRVEARVLFEELCAPLADRAFTGPESATHCIGG